MAQIESPVFFATLGFPGSGKTHFSKLFSQEFGIVHINSDRVRADLFGDKPKHSREENQMVFRMMDLFAEEVLKSGHSVIYDANSTKLEFRVRYQELARRYNAAYVLLYFQTPVETALGRISDRSKEKPEEEQKYYKDLEPHVLHDIRAEEEPPTTEPFVIIDGTKPYEMEVSKIVDYLKHSKL
jgi:predicted kinase